MKTVEGLKTRLEQFFESDYNQLRKNIIVKDGDVYEVFDRYRIEAKGRDILVYRSDYLIGSFTTLKIALSWCITDKYNQNSIAESIKNFDQKRGILQADIEVSQHLLRGIRDADRKETVVLKVETKKSQLKYINEQLDKYSSIAKYWQIQGFNDEIARTRRPASNRSNNTSYRNSPR